MSDQRGESTGAKKLERLAGDVRMDLVAAGREGFAN